MVLTMSEEDVINCTISHEIHQYLFSCVYILVLLVSVCGHLVIAFFINVHRQQ